MLWITNARADSTDSRETFHLGAFMSPLLFFSSHTNFYKYTFLLLLIVSFDNDDMKSSKRHGALLSYIFEYLNL